MNLSLAAQTTLVLDPILPVGAVLILGLGLTAATVAIYRRAGARLSRAQNGALLVFRLLGVAAVPALQLQPSRLEEIPPVVTDRVTVVAVDDSKSMAQKDVAQGTRAQAARSILTDAGVVGPDGAVGEAKVRLFKFSEDAAPITGTALAAQPNIVVVLADQWRAQAFGFAGDVNVRTPNFDRLAGESVRFVNAVAGLPVCSPTRASLLTGQRPLTHGVFLNDVPLKSEAVTLPKVLKAAGYDTAAIGKWHIDGHGRSAFIPPERRQGFDYWKVLECTHNYTDSIYYGDTAEKLHWSGYDALDQTRDACEFLRARAKSAKPFLLWLAWGPPHDPYMTAPEKYRALYDPAKLTLRPNVPANLAAQARKNLAGYYAHCSALDDAMGELLAALRESGLAENTILVFSADHGDMLGSQGLWKKQKPFDESARVPMLIRWPAVLGKDARSLAAPINSEDVMPTLLGLSGVAIPPSVEGLDFSGHLLGKKAPGDDATVLMCVAPFGEFERGKGGREYRGVRTAHHTYVRDLAGPWLLFDNDADPSQQKNLIGQPAHAALQTDLDAQLARKLKANGDAFLPGADYIQQRGYQVDANGTAPYTP